MNLVSYNLKNYIDFSKIDNLTVRVNSCWHSNTLYEDLEQVKEYPVFFDFDCGRVKPPSSGLKVSDLDQILLDFPNIKYLAVSNVEEIKDLKPFVHLSVKLVPKIETARGIKLFVGSYDPLYFDLEYVSLDHGDLFNDLITHNLSSHLYHDWINPFIIKCGEKGLKVLRERGLLFSER